MPELELSDLQDYLISHDGRVISEATLKTSDLLQSYYGVIMGYNLQTSLKASIESLFEGDVLDYSTFHDELNIDTDENASELKYYCEDYFNSISPEGFYFGCTEGDGACIGFFKAIPEDADF